MTCKRTDLGPVTVWSCGRKKPDEAKSLCEVCKERPQARACIGMRRPT